MKTLDNLLLEIRPSTPVKFGMNEPDFDNMQIEVTKKVRRYANKNSDYPKVPKK